MGVARIELAPSAMAEVAGFEPTEWQDQNLLAYHLPIPQYYKDKTYELRISYL